MAHALHLGRVSVEHAVVMCLDVFGENVVELLRGRVTVCGAGLLGHLDASVGHEGPLERLVGLQSHHTFQVAGVVADISGTVSGERRYHFGLHVEHATLGTLFLLQLLELAPKCLCGRRGSLEKTLVALVDGVVILNKITKINFCLPLGSLETSPFFSHSCS